MGYSTNIIPGFRVIRRTGNTLSAVTIILPIQQPEVVDIISPVLTQDTYTLLEGAAASLLITTNDYDVGSGLDLDSIVITTQPQFGTLTITGGGRVQYTHDHSDTTYDYFSYTIRDKAGNLGEPAIVHLNITPVQDDLILHANTYAQIGDEIITGASVLYSYEGDPIAELITSDGSEYDPIVYPKLHEVLSTTPLPFSYLVNSSNNWIDTGSRLETSGLSDDSSAVLELTVPFDTTVGVRVSSERGYDIFTVRDAYGALIWSDSGEESAEVTLLAANSPFTFEYIKDEADYSGEDTAYIEYVTDMYPVITRPVLPNSPTEEGSPFPWKIVADYTGD